MTTQQGKITGIGDLTRNFAFPHWPWYGAGLVFLAVTNLITLQIPQLAKNIINHLAEGEVMDGMARIALIIIGLGTIQMFIRALSRICIFWPGRKLEADVKRYLFDKSLRLPFSFYLQHGMGDLISRISNDVNHLRVFYAFGFLQFANILFLTALIITQMLSVHVVLTILCLCPLIAMFAITRLIVPKMHEASKENQVAVGALTNRVTESFVNIHVIQTNSIEDTFQDRCKIENDRVYESHMRLVFIRTFLFPLMTCLAGLSQLAVLFYGGYQTIAGHLTVGDILAFNIYIGLLTFPLTAIGIILAIVQRAKTAIERVREIDLAPAETTASVDQTSRIQVDPKVMLSIRNLEFRFPKELLDPGQQDTNTPVLSIENLTILKGQKLGVCGPIGSGKSTLLHLISRLYDPPKATIYLEGEDIRTLSPETLRQKIGYALQSVHLFSESIAGNLRFGIDVAPEVIREVIDQSVLSTDIAGFKNGLETEIGERGLRLSGGQKQRLALARLMARKPSMLLLDDVLSAVDQKTEQALIRNLFKSDQTALVVSHRPSALQACDQVILLERGQIKDQGSYLELIRRNPHLEVLAESAHEN